MAQQLANLVKRGTLPQQVSGQSVAKLMRAHGRRMDTGALEAMANNGSNTTGPQKATDRGFGVIRRWNRR
jgi:hypothetical protein